MKAALRPIILLAVLLASSLAFAAQASAGTGALAVTDEIALGRVDGNSTHELTVRIDNSDGDEAAGGALDVQYVQIQAYTEEERLGIQDWITGPDWSVGAGEVVEETWTLTVPEDASPGPYTLAMAFTRHDYDDDGNQTAGAEVAATTLAKFTVRGVVWSGYFHIPQTMENGSKIADTTMVLRNYDDVDYVDGFIQRSVYQPSGSKAHDPVLRWWDNQTIPAGGEASYTYNLSLGGKGRLDLDLWAEYWLPPDNDTHYQTRTYERSIHITGPPSAGGGGGSTLFLYHNATLGYHDHGQLTPQGEAMTIPSATPWWFTIDVENVRTRDFELPLYLHLDGEVIATVEATLPAQETTTVRFALDGLPAGSYEVAFLRSDSTRWTGTLVVEDPDVAAMPPTWEDGKLGAEIKNAGVGAHACHQVTLLHLDQTIVDIFEPSKTCQFIARDDVWQFLADPDLSDLPPGDYLIRVQTTWDGQDEPVRWDIPITVEQDGTVIRGDPAVTSPPSSSRAGAADGPRSVVLWLYLVGTAASVAVMLGLVTARRGAGNKGQKPPF